MRLPRPAGAVSRSWILGPWNDMAWFILAPVWILALAWAVKDMAVVGVLGGVLLALGATGHHLPGFIRAYTDPELFRRFRTRFLLAPAFFVGVCAAFAVFDLHGLELILFLWGAWHGAMQVSGFLRIYDSKVGSTSGATAWLDWALCAAWFAGGFLHSENRLHLLGLTLNQSGLVLPSPESVLAFRQAWDLLTVLVTAAFLVNMLAQIRRGRPPNFLKIPTLLSSIGFWWFCMVHVQAPLLGLLLFEIFHDVQYNALVWVYQGSRVSKGLTTSRVERFLFRPSVARIAVYIVLILGYGSIGVAANYSGLHTPGMQASTGVARFLAYLFIASAFLHFYFDGFIWKVREARFRAGLEIATSDRNPGADGTLGTERRRPAIPLWLPVGLRWAFFVIPVASLFAAQVRGKVQPPVEMYRSLAPLVPGTWDVHYVLGGLELEAGNSAAAAASLQAACDLNPGLGIRPKQLADLYLKSGDVGRAIGQYRRALERDPKDLATRYDLGLLLRDQGKVDEAIPELVMVADRNPDHGGTNYSAAVALMLSRRLSEAIPYLERSVSAEPGNKQAWNFLGVARQAMGLVPEAVLCYQRALALDSGFIEARNNLRDAERRVRDAGI